MCGVHSDDSNDLVPSRSDTVPCGGICDNSDIEFSMPDCSRLLCVSEVIVYKFFLTQQIYHAIRLGL